MMLVIPFLGAVAAAFWVFGKSVGEKPSPEEKAVLDNLKKSATKAAKEKRWDVAVAEAIASRDPATVKLVVSALNKAGMKDAAKELSKVIDQWKKLNNEAKRKKNKAKPAAKPPKASKPAAKPPKASKPPTVISKPPRSSQKPSGSGGSSVDSGGAGSQDSGSSEVVLPADTVLSSSAAKRMAESLVDHLNSTKRYSEDQKQVKDYQAQNALSADGKYGPATARSLWNIYSLVPPNPFYWGKASDVGPYTKFLDGIALENPNLKSAIETKKKTVGK